MNEAPIQSAPICETCGLPRPQGSWPICEDGSGKHGHTAFHGGNRLSSIHASERAVIYRNPRTGEVRYPARNDQPVPAVYAKQGYVREELATARDVAAFEKSTGRIHERSWYDNGSATAERDAVAAIAPPPPIRGLDEPSGG